MTAVRRVETIGDCTLYLGDCRDVLREMPDASVDAVVTDPPYGLGFMGKDWDHAVPGVEIWRAVLRVLKPGGHLLAFAGTRTQHRMACAVEDAGFEIRDMIAWVYGSGFPKSLDVSKAVSATEAAERWKGWGTALKPALEPITVARRPLSGSIAANVLAHGTGAINVDKCRIETIDAVGWGGHRGGSDDLTQSQGRNYRMGAGQPRPASGRFPTNLVHDGSDEVMRLFPETGASSRAARNNGEPGRRPGGFGNVGHDKGSSRPNGEIYADTGSAARFFYCAKASREDRDDGLRGFEARVVNITEGHGRGAINTSKGDGTGIRENRPRRNHHPTVKPTDLMRYLVRLVTPPGGVVLDPFAGSGSTGRGAAMEGLRFAGVEIDPEYFEIACKRIAAAAAQQRLQLDAAAVRGNAAAAQGALF